MAERLIAPVLKTGRPKGLVSSNLTPSASLVGWRRRGKSITTPHNKAAEIYPCPPLSAEAATSFCFNASSNPSRHAFRRDDRSSITARHNAQQPGKALLTRCVRNSGPEGPRTAAEGLPAFSRRPTRMICGALHDFASARYKVLNREHLFLSSVKDALASVWFSEISAGELKFAAEIQLKSSSRDSKRCIAIHWFVT